LRDAPLGKNWNEKGEGHWRGEYFDIERQIMTGKKPSEIIKTFSLKKEIPLWKRLYLRWINDINRLENLRRLTTIGVRERSELIREGIKIPSNYPLKYQSIMEEYAWAEKTRTELKKYELKMFEHIDFHKIDILLADVLANITGGEKKCQLDDINALKNECKMIFELLQELKSHDYPTLMSVVICDQKRVFLGFHKPYRLQSTDEFTYVIVSESEIGLMFHKYFSLLWSSNEWTRPLIWEEGDNVRWEPSYSIFREVNPIYFKDIWERINSIKIIASGDLNSVMGNLIFESEVNLWNKIERIIP
jgi:hypothetical protein